jgi:hypothetical protein
MRLTLRTLLAWLDDTLPAHEVRTIGQQVEESAYARDIADRIQRVTRQRRLTVPPSNGTELNDPNVVAEYLDNVMSADQVSEYEKLCLTSDVHLAEVASAHQILSLLGQRARVPAEARYRMYQLVKGQEGYGGRARHGDAEAEAEPVAARVPSWRPGAEPRRWTWRPRPIAAAVGLVLVLCWATWDNLRPRPRDAEETAPAGLPGVAARHVEIARREAPPANPAAVPGAGAERPARPAGELAHGAGAGAPPPAPAEDVAEGGAAEVVAEAGDSGEPAKAAPRPAAPGRAAGSVAEAVGVLMRRPDAELVWNRADANAPIEPGDWLLNIDPFRATVALGPLRLRLVRTTRLHVLSPTRDASAGVDLQEGRVVVTSPGAAGTLALAMPGGGTAQLDLPADVPVGIERARQWSAGVATPTEPPWTIHLPEGTLEITDAGKTTKLSGPGRLDLGPQGPLGPARAEEAPPWVVEPRPTAAEEEAAQQFARFFRRDQPPRTNLAEAATSDRPEIQRMAFEGLAAIGHLSLVVGALNVPDQPATRRAAIDTLRHVLAGGEADAARLREELARDGDAWAAQVQALLVGLTLEQFRNPMAAADLVQALDAPDVAIRELALDNLMRLTARGDALGYDPDKPKPEGIRAWQELVVPAETPRRERR